jgi:LemA protein
LEWIIVIVIIAIALIIWYIATMNNFRRAEVKIDEALSDIDVALIKRHDVLVKMLDISKSYAQYERDTLFGTIKLRSGMNMSDRNQAISEMDQAGKFINAVAEDYPELKSSENFRQLQLSVMDVEEHLQAARRLYNGNISYLNQKIVSFPGSIVARNINIQKREFLEATAAEKQDIKMQL